MKAVSTDSLSYCGWDCRRCPGDTCLGCRAGAGEPGCATRECAKNKGVVTCAMCGDFPCAIITPALEKFSLLASICKGIREAGIDSWTEEQDKLAGQKYDFS